MHANVQAERINGPKNVYCLQLELHLPERSEIRRFYWLISFLFVIVVVSHY